ncbi:hypothetical protein D9V30_10255 [Mycetocola reblochoni]|uniref:Phage minor capsid protein \|nr:hypothetical protein [Mycetocola reblochoni]RLP68362.1 hypothetical protein D9V30_10255 [Mycetocola reblochoni]SJN34077.1 Phage minor capsid protein \
MLPRENTSWPPSPWDHAYATYAENEAWYLGDTKRLQAIYRRQGQATHTHRGELHTGGVVGAVSRMFWGRPVPPGEHRTRVHIPAPSDLATLSSDLIFSEPPEVTLSVEDKKAQARLDVIGNSDDAHAMFNTMGELKSVFGATALVTRWDTDIADHAWLECAAADVVIPTFRSGKLASLALWTEHRDGQRVYRHVEDHQPGFIEHALYLGTADNLGRRVPLQERPETEHLALLVDGDSRMLTGIDRLTASYNINMPSRAWRKRGQLAHAGRSDFAGALQLFDAIDETWSSWMRDLKLAGGKVIVPDAYLQSNGRGKGAFFDESREFMVGINSPGDPNGAGKLDVVQFKIRVEEHERTLYGLYKELLRHAGYSHSVWGEYNSSSQATATEVEDRNKASERTRDKKALFDRAAIAEQSATALEVDGLLFPGKGGGRFDLPQVVFPEVSQIDPEKGARVVQLLSAAGAASTQTLVARANPDWDEARVTQEVEAIEAVKQSSRMVDPAGVTF